ncbi:MAG TPA: PEP-CTERM sorting domain-containing protein [Armatimonadota bacterium]|jgi:hypothetical protein
MRKAIALLLGLSLAAGGGIASADSVFDVNGFEGYNLGTAPGQSMRGDAVDPSGTPKWIADSSDRVPPAPQPVTDILQNDFTTQTGHNKVLSLDPSSLSTNDYAGTYLPFGEDLVALGESKITIQFDQFRDTLNQTAFVLEAPGPYRSDSSWSAYEYGLNGQFYPSGRVSGAGLPMIAGQWQRVQLDLDFDALTVTASLDGVPTSPAAQPFALGNGGVAAFRGIGFRVYGTDRGSNGANYIDNLSVTGHGGTVPEPGSLALLGIGILPLLRRRKA